jgi:hypothetical protein
VNSGVLKNTTTPNWEAASTVARTMIFRVTVRDNNPDIHAQQTQNASCTVTVASAGPFKVTSHTTNTQYTGGSSTAITWNIAGTNAAPINTQNVSIILSKDNGANFDTVLAASVPNIGVANVVLPNEDISSARIMVKAENNIYYALNSSFFSIKKDLATAESNMKNFAIYPNPANNEVNVVLKNKSESATYTIYDTAGRIAATGALAQDGKINIERLTSGNYILNINLKNGDKLTDKLMIKK